MNIREAMRKPPKSPPQLLSIPNREAVLAAFKRAQTYPLDLIAIELETHQSLHGNGYKLVAFVRDGALNAQHIMPAGEISERQLLGAAEILAQTLSMGARRKLGAPDGRGRAERSVQFGQ